MKHLKVFENYRLNESIEEADIQDILNVMIDEGLEVICSPFVLEDDVQVLNIYVTKDGPIIWTELVRIKEAIERLEVDYTIGGMVGTQFVADIGIGVFNDNGAQDNKIDELTEELIETYIVSVHFTITDHI